jgi:hypothetical protein
VTKKRAHGIVLTHLLELIARWKARHISATAAAIGGEIGAIL